MDSTTPARESSNEDVSLSRKRTRVTPSQLRILEDVFAASATPGSKMRKQLATQLDMSERSIQIWFQNRRAKVKTLQKRALLREEHDATRAYGYSSAFPFGFQRPHPKMPIPRAWSTDGPSLQSLPTFYSFPGDMATMPPTLHSSSSNTMNRHNRVSPSLPVFLGKEALSRRTDSESISAHSFSHYGQTTFSIPVNSVTVGHWHRMRINRHDLHCQYDIQERTLTWYIRDSIYYFKMVLPFHSISSIRLTVLEDTAFATVDIDIMEPPLFFMEGGHSATIDHPHWIQCSDFTEGVQANCVLCHTLQGYTSDLKREMLALAEIDHRLAQIMSLSQEQHESHFPMVLQNWRHQSVPIHEGHSL
ncbi:homeobox domain-containing protein [Spinellus fusiger]|nr:homeobox domain-containing protein [Spinellus fusiger]